MRKEKEEIKKKSKKKQWPKHRQDGQRYRHLTGEIETMTEKEQLEMLDRKASQTKMILAKIEEAKK
jgi:hypothetical protein